MFATVNNIVRRLEGKVAIITGGAGGIGESIARVFIREGAKVIIADIADKRGLELCQDLGPQTTYLHCNVSKEEDMKSTVDETIKMHGHLDIMFNNAGVIENPNPNPNSAGVVVSEHDMDDFDRVMNVNVKGAMLGIKHAGRVMIPRKAGSIICTASIAGIMGGMSPYAYTASKHAVLGLVKNAAAEMGKYGIRVNSVSPFGVATSMSVGVFKSVETQETDHGASGITVEDKLKVEERCNSLANLKGTVLRAEDVAEAGLFLASDEAKYVSGHNLVVDGGFTVVNHSLGLYQ